MSQSTDQANCAQLIVYARFIANNTIEEELLFSEPLKTTTNGADVFQAVSQFFEVYSLMWEKLVGVCTDGAPAMLGSRSGFVKMVKSKNPSIFAMHCVIYRQALVAKTLPDDLRDDLNFAVEVVNYVKSSALNARLFAALCESLNADHMALLYHTEVRWLSIGNILGLIYELREAVAEFLEQRGRRTMCRAFKKYIKYGFVAIEKNGVEVPQCVVCLDTLSNDALRPTRLQRHLHNRHPELSKKTFGIPLEYLRL
ncbi:Protein ZBED8 [Trichinella nativa]|uniref:Protein ZBED8 n=1 Tax=Trichinella nativa TaxID=6335 RepID=A0A0V1KMW7_9BILA|nr:Protein ZBED8 [Trichinella nativa]